MTSVVKDRTQFRRNIPNQNHNKHHTPGVIINYHIFCCIHISFSFVILLCDYILSYSFMYTFISVVGGLL